MASAEEMKDGFFKKGVLIRSKDTHRGGNEGLGDREIKALAEENISPWGQRSFRESAIKGRARQAGHK